MRSNPRIEIPSHHATCVDLALYRAKTGKSWRLRLLGFWRAARIILTSFSQTINTAQGRKGYLEYSERVWQTSINRQRSHDLSTRTREWHHGQWLYDTRYQHSIHLSTFLSERFI